MSSALPQYGDYVRQEQQVAPPQQYANYDRQTVVEMPSDIAAVLDRVFQEHRMMLTVVKSMNERLTKAEWFLPNFENRLRALESRSGPIQPYPGQRPYP
jgi:hypothetical protein